MTLPVYRDASSHNKQHNAQLQQQLDSAQADLGKAASQMKQQQDAKDGLEQQLQQVSGQLAARQQEDTQVGTHSVCLLPKSPPGQAAEPSLTPMHTLTPWPVLMHSVVYKAVFACVLLLTPAVSLLPYTNLTEGCSRYTQVWESLCLYGASLSS